MIGPVKPSLEGAYLEHFGIKGMRWGHSKSANAASSGKSGKRAVTDIRKRKFSDAEIIAARKRHAEDVQKFQEISKKNKKNVDLETGKPKWTSEHDKAYSKWRDSDDAYIANVKTKGEKKIARLLGGPFGAIKTADFRTAARAANETSDTPEEKRSRQLKYAGRVALIGATYMGVVIASRNMGAIGSSGRRSMKAPFNTNLINIGYQK